MPPIHEVSVAGIIPHRQDYSRIDIPASSGTAVEIASDPNLLFVDIKVKAACKLINSVDSSGVAAKISSGDYKPLAADSQARVYQQKNDEGVFVIADADSVSSNGLELAKYFGA